MLTFAAFPEFSVINPPRDAIFARVYCANRALFGIVSYGIIQDAMTSTARFGDDVAFCSPRLETETGNFVGEDDVDAYLDHVARRLAC